MYIQLQIFDHSIQFTDKGLR